jgi:hypothetical protein
MPEIPAVEFAVPRNPAVPSPSFGDVMCSPPLERDRDGHPSGMRVHLYEGAGIPPPAPPVDSGPLVSFESGLLFVATAGNAGWREALQEIGRLVPPMASGLAGDLALPVEGAIATALRRTAADTFVREMKGQDAQQARRQDLERRLRVGHTFVLPYVDIARTRTARVRSGLKKSCYTAVAIETSRGETRTLCLKGVDAGLAERWMGCRFEQEFLCVTSAVWDELLGQQELWDSLARRFPDVSAVPVGRLWDEWKLAVRARLAARSLTQGQVATAALQRMGPSLDRYRQIPAARQAVEAAEVLAAGAPAPR